MLLDVNLDAEQLAWDTALLARGGHFLQSWRWGEFLHGQGWQVERIRVVDPRGVGMAQVLFRHRGPVSLASLPRGPVIDGDSEVLTRQVIEAVDEACRRHRAIDLVVERDLSTGLTGPLEAAGFVRGTTHRYPVRTVKVPLLNERELLAQMQRTTRYNLRAGRKQGVTVTRAAAGPSGVATFYDLLQETANRNAFHIESQEYYQDFMRIFGDDAVLLFAIADDTVAAAMIGVRFGTEAMYLFGASSTMRRVRGATVCLQLEAMGWARALGCTRYDLWGIPADDPPAAGAGEDEMRSRGADMRGLYHFKVGFGGEIVTYPPILEHRYRPYLSRFVRRVWSARPALAR